MFRALDLDIDLNKELVLENIPKTEASNDISLLPPSNELKEG